MESLKNYKKYLQLVSSDLKEIAESIDEDEFEKEENMEEKLINEVQQLAQRLAGAGLRISNSMAELRKNCVNS